MEIIYPPLVEEGFAYLKRLPEQEALTKAELYQMMVADHLITETGMPTRTAIEAGFIKDYHEAEDLSFAEFMELFPIFKRYAEDLFEKIDGYWEIPETFKQALKKNLAKNIFSYDERMQVNAYLQDR